MQPQYDQRAGWAPVAHQAYVQHPAMPKQSWPAAGPALPGLQEQLEAQLRRSSELESLVHAISRERDSLRAQLDQALAELQRLQTAGLPAAPAAPPTSAASSQRVPRREPESERIQRGRLSNGPKRAPERQDDTVEIVVTVPRVLTPEEALEEQRASRPAAAFGPGVFRLPSAPPIPYSQVQQSACTVVRTLQGQPFNFASGAFTSSAVVPAGLPRLTQWPLPSQSAAGYAMRVPQ